MSGIRLHKNYIWLAAAVLVGLLCGALLLLAVSQKDNNTLSENAAERAALLRAEPVLRTLPDTDGFALRILTDAAGEVFFCTDETDAETLAQRVYARGAHLMEETGATVTETYAADFVQAARTDILSGAYEANLYAADAAGSLSSLLATASLLDVSGSRMLRTGESWFDSRIMDSLAVGGKQYLMSSSAVDARLGAVAVVYNRKLLPAAADTLGEEIDLSAMAFEGDFTLEVLLSAVRAADGGMPGAPGMQVQTAEGAAADGTTGTPMRGLAMNGSDLFALFFGIGGNFIEPETGETVDYAAFSDTLSRVLDFYTAADPAPADAFRRGEACFTLVKLADLGSLGIAEGCGILPLPKLSAGDDYRSYIELRGTAMAAVPAGAPDADKVLYLFERMSFLSRGYIEPAVRESVTGTNGDDARMLALIYDSADSSVTDLFGYGDIPGWVAAVAEGGTYRLKLEYYKRKNLCEKAFSILAKRLAPAAETK